jgi:hypothetical protein
MVVRDPVPDETSSSVWPSGAWTVTLWKYVTRCIALIPQLCVGPKRVDKRSLGFTRAVKRASVRRRYKARFCSRCRRPLYCSETSQGRRS